jgi:hypothetical protein
MVGCLAVIVALLTPRLVLFMMWLFSDYLNHAFQSGWWGLLGFLFLPATTIMWAIAENEFTAAGGGIQATGIVLIVLGVVIDLGLLGGSGRGVQRSRA